MKKIAITLLLIVFGAGSCLSAYAATGNNKVINQTRADRKMQKKQEKAMKKYRKAQKKAEQKMIKKDRKNTHLPTHY
jgi:3-hydroxy-3-methylglutaryl CoA synthase